jgi:mannose-6-phosphate isomerase-like protein (cupin superfamily)
VKSNPNVYHVVLDNESVRVLHVSVPVGGKTTTHERPDDVIVALTDSRVRLTSADGKSADSELAGDLATCFDTPRATAYRATTEPDFHEPAGTIHDYDQIVIALGTGSVSVDVEGRTKRGWKRGDVLFIGRGMKHETKNTSGKPLSR